MFLAALWVKPEKTVLSVGYRHPFYKTKRDLAAPKLEKAEEDC
jgi:hypothetical protein